MQYFGGKARQARHIAPYLIQHVEPGARYVEPFLGGGSVAALAAKHFEFAELSDVVPDLILLWQSVAAGWIPPTELTRAEYETLRTAEPSALRAFAGFGCSFAAKWFGGYAADYPPKAQHYAGAASRGLVRKAQAIGPHAAFACQDYRSTTVRAGDVVYCDPPYSNTSGYRATVDDFDSADFWRVAESWTEIGARVYVSEFIAPEGWESALTLARVVTSKLLGPTILVPEHLFTR